MAAVKSGAAFQQLVSMEVRESIGRFKYTEEEKVDAVYEELMDSMARAIRDMTREEDGSDD